MRTRPVPPLCDPEIDHSPTPLGVPLGATWKAPGVRLEAAAPGRQSCSHRWAANQRTNSASFVRPPAYAPRPPAWPRLVPHGERSVPRAIVRPWLELPHLSFVLL